MDEKIREQIIGKMHEISDLVSERLDENQEVSNISYYNDFQFQGSNLAVENVYIVEIKSENQSETGDNSSIYAIYNKDNQLIATVSEDGKVHFAREFLEQLREIDEKYFEQLNLEDLNFELPEEESKEDMKMSKEELDKDTKDLSTDKQGKKEEEKEEEKEESEEEKKEKSAEALGIETDEVKSICTINPNEKITDKYNLIDIMPEASEYEEISIVYSDSSQEGYGQFTIMGVKKDGTREVVNSIEPVEGTTGNKNVISINEDGSKVEEKQVQGLFLINARSVEDGIAVSIGDYGMLNVDYVSNVLDKENRRSTPIRTKEVENQRESTVRVRENAGDSKDEMKREGQIFRQKEEEGVDPQTLDGIDTDQAYGNISLDELKNIIKEEILDQELSGSEVEQFIKDEIYKSGLNLNDEEVERATQEIQTEALDESRFPTRGPRM